MTQHIIDDIYIGDWQDARYLYTRKERVIIFTVAKDSPFIGQYYYPLIDGQSSDNEKILLDAVNDLILTRKMYKERILVHCVSGISRSTAVIAGYMIIQGYTITTEDALTRIKKIRPIANPVQEFVTLLRKYEKDKPRLYYDSSTFV